MSLKDNMLAVAVATRIGETTIREGLFTTLICIPIS
jgi:hypothetical protein